MKNGKKVGREGSGEGRLRYRMAKMSAKFTQLVSDGERSNPALCLSDS